MSKSIKLFFLMLALSVGVFAQTDSDDFKRNEFFVGFSNQQVKNLDYDSFNGVEASYVRNVSRYFGIKGDFSATYRKDRFNGAIPDPVTGATVGTFNLNSSDSLYNVLGGVQIKDNASKSRIKPFAHALAGVAYYRNKNRITAPLEIVRRRLRPTATRLPKRVSARQSAADSTLKSTTKLISALSRLITIRFAISDNGTTTSASASVSFSNKSSIKRRMKSNSTN